MTTYTMTRPGLPPLRFDGYVLGRAFTKVGKREYLACVYRTDNAALVLSVAFNSEWERETGYNWVAVAQDVPELVAQYKSWDPIPAGVGFPVGEAYAEKQKRLVAELKAAFDASISEAFAVAGIVEDI